MKGLQGKRVLITGASSGIGAGMAQVLASYGCKLVLHYCKNETGIEQTLANVKNIGAEAEVIRCDFRELNTLNDFFAKAWQLFDGLDALVNNAGIVTKVTSIKDADAMQFNETLAVNLQAPYQLSCEFAKHCIAAKQPGRIVNNSSIHGQQTCEWFAAYAASKAGLDAISKVQAIEWGQFGINVNVLAPGVVPVERTDHILGQEHVKAKWMNNMPTGRYGTVEEMGEATAYLLSEHTRWMSGSTITLDGGMLARGNYPQR